MFPGVVGTHERTVMLEKCGSKCFAGPVGTKRFHICDAGTCKINPKGVWAAYVRSKEYGSKKMHRKPYITTAKERKGRKKRFTKKVYNQIASKTRKMLSKGTNTEGAL
jgi:hypothetical protein